MADITVDITALKKLGSEIEAATIVALDRLGRRGAEFLREEVPNRTGNMRLGVATPYLDKRSRTVVLTVSAKSANQSGSTATVHYVSGETKTVNLRPQVGYYYADVVARGNKDAVVRPKNGGVFLIPVVNAPGDETYLEAGGKFFVVRRSHKGMKANPYDERAAKRLEREAESIVGHVFTEFFR